MCVSIFFSLFFSESKNETNIKNEIWYAYIFRIPKLKIAVKMKFY